MLTAITGINWGDEGKGRMVDLLSQDYDIVARYQGGDNEFGDLHFSQLTLTHNAH